MPGAHEAREARRPAIAALLPTSEALAAGYYLIGYVRGMRGRPADGPTLVKEAQKFYPEMRVMYISGYAEDAFRDMVRLEEKIRFLAKPFSLKVLAARVKETLEAPLEKAIISSSETEDNTVDLVKYKYHDSHLKNTPLQEPDSTEGYSAEEGPTNTKA